MTSPNPSCRPRPRLRGPCTRHSLAWGGLATAERASPPRPCEAGESGSAGPGPPCPPTTLCCHSPKQEPGTASRWSPQAPWLCLRSPEQPVRKPLGSWGSGVAARVQTSHLLQTLRLPLAASCPRHPCTGSPPPPTPHASVLPEPPRHGPRPPRPVPPAFGTAGISVRVPGCLRPGARSQHVEGGDGRCSVPTCPARWWPPRGESLPRKAEETGLASQGAGG